MKWRISRGEVGDVLTEKRDRKKNKPIFALYTVDYDISKRSFCLVNYTEHVEYLSMLIDGYFFVQQNKDKEGGEDTGARPKKGERLKESEVMEF